MKLNTDKVHLELASVLQISLQHGWVAEKSATRMHLVQNPLIPTWSPAMRMQRQKICNTDRCVAEPETCTTTPGTCTKIPVQIYIRANAMGQENKIQSHHISEQTRCVRPKKNSCTHFMPQQKYSTNEWGEVSNNNDHNDFDDYDDGRKHGRGGDG